LALSAVALPSLPAGTPNSTCRDAFSAYQHIGLPCPMMMMHAMFALPTSCMQGRSASLCGRV
jgi:hypothetical protein